jgi:hypothetical protein
MNEGQEFTYTRKKAQDADKERLLRRMDALTHGDAIVLEEGVEEMFKRSSLTADELLHAVGNVYHDFNVDSYKASLLPAERKVLDTIRTSKFKEESGAQLANMARNALSNQIETFTKRLQ